VGVPLVALASQLMVGKTLEELDFTEEPAVPAVFVKAPVFPFSRFPGVDPVLGPEMKSTGEVMGWSPGFGSAFAKALLGAGVRLPNQGAAFLSVHDRDKPGLLPVARRLAELGFDLLATWGTAEYLKERGLEVRPVNKVHEARPHVSDHLINGDIHLIVNTPMGRESFEDDAHIRTTALRLDIPCITTLSGATAAVEGIAAQRTQAEFDVRSLQSLDDSAASPAPAESTTTARAS
jgi:carbamoyl-phosphate synthase large subunit